ncbi:glutaredoxin-like protein C5orf63 homolog isoform X2 [Antedon mediterranea]
MKSILKCAGLVQFQKQPLSKQMKTAALLRRVTSSQAGYLPLLTLYTKEDCSLCDTAMEVVNKHKHRFQFEEVDIEEKGNEMWFDKYRYDIPVFHLNGRFLMKHRADEEHFLKSLDLCEQDEPS